MGPLVFSTTLGLIDHGRECHFPKALYDELEGMSYEVLTAIPYYEGKKLCFMVGMTQVHPDGSGSGSVHYYMSCKYCYQRARSELEETSREEIRIQSYLEGRGLVL